MYTIHSLGVNEAWLMARAIIEHHAIREQSRNGPVLAVPVPVSTHYEHPQQRVLFDPSRDANPFFHLLEALWMLAGRNDVEFVTRYVGRMADFSDDGKTFHGAYGYRWRHHFDGDREEDDADQLKKVTSILRHDQYSRRAVVQMWDPHADLWSPADEKRAARVPRDLPCNTAIYFDLRSSRLNMTVTNRSNDIVWGCYGANVVHMSILQEYMAAQIGVPVGWYCQMSNNWHAYEQIWKNLKLAMPMQHEYPRIVKLVDDPTTFDAELTEFMANPVDLKGYWNNGFFRAVAQPLARGYQAFKNESLRPAERINQALREVELGEKCDWTIAAKAWLQRRASRQQKDPVLNNV